MRVSQYGFYEYGTFTKNMLGHLSVRLTESLIIMIQTSISRNYNLIKNMAKFVQNALEISKECVKN